jgi:UDP-glucose 4-epimerase
MLTHINNLEIKPSRVVILGCNGFVGSSISEQLINIDIPILKLGKNNVNLLNSNSHEILARNLNDNDFLITVSAIAPVKNEQMFNDNIFMINQVCKTLRMKKIKYLLNISSDAVFSDSMNLINEKSIKSPENLHGAMHLAREIILNNCLNDLSISFAHLRPTLIYGKNDPHSGYGPNLFRRKLIENQNITLFGNGEELRDHIFINDVSALAVKMILNQSVGSLNAVTGNVKSFEEIAELMKKIFNKKITINKTKRTTPMPHNGYRAFDSSLITKSFPDFVVTDLLEGLNKLL